MAEIVSGKRFYFQMSKCLAAKFGMAPKCVKTAVAHLLRVSTVSVQGEVVLATWKSVVADEEEEEERVRFVLAEVTSTAVEAWTQFTTRRLMLCLAALRKAMEEDDFVAAVEAPDRLAKSAASELGAGSPTEAEVVAAEKAPEETPQRKVRGEVKKVKVPEAPKEDKPDSMDEEEDDDLPAPGVDRSLTAEQVELDPARWLNLSDLQLMRLQVLLERYVPQQQGEARTILDALLKHMMTLLQGAAPSTLLGDIFKTFLYHHHKAERGVRAATAFIDHLNVDERAPKALKEATHIAMRCGTKRTTQEQGGGPTKRGRRGGESSRMRYRDQQPVPPPVFRKNNRYYPRK